jgi:hypothetical protein
VLNIFDFFERYHETCCSFFCPVSVLQRAASYRWMVTDIDTLGSMLVRFYYVSLFLGSLLVTPIPILLARVTIGWCLARKIFDLMDMTNA